MDLKISVFLVLDLFEGAGRQRASFLESDIFVRICFVVNCRNTESIANGYESIANGYLNTMQIENYVFYCP